MFLLSLIIPVGPTPDNFANLKSWLVDFSHKNVQVIFSIDTDDSETLRSFNDLLKDLPHASESPSIEIVHSTGDGPGSARNSGLENASGKWIAFWDSDDVPNPSAFLEMIQEAESYNCDVIFGSYIQMDSLTKKVLSENPYVGFIPPKKIPLLLLNPGIWRYVFRGDFVAGTRFEPWNMAEDQDYLGRVLSLGGSVVGVSNCVYLYDRSHLEQLTKKPYALSDLLLSQEKNAALSLKDKSSYSIWILLFCKQTLTALRTLPHSKKYAAARVFCQTFFKLKPVRKLLVFRYLYMIIFDRKF